MKPMTSHNSRNGARLIAVLGAFAVSTAVLVGGCPGLTQSDVLALFDANADSFRGSPGAPGGDGVDGPDGEQGDTGAPGQDGEPGGMGVPGPDGAPGPQGNKGDPGDITGVTAGSGLTGGGQTGNVTVSLGTVGLEKIDTSGASAGDAIMYDGNDTVWMSPDGGSPMGPAGGDLTGTYPNPQIAGGAVGTNEIANAAVTLDNIDAPGASNGKVLKTDGAGMFWATADTGGSPIVELNEADTSVVLTTSWQTVLQISISVPSSGKIHLIGNATLKVATNDADLGIAPSGGTPSHIIARANHFDPQDISASAKIPTTTQWLTPVDAGPHTYRLMARRLLNNDGHTTAVSFPQLSATFYPD